MLIRNLKNNQGFSLFEQSISLIILAMILSSGIFYVTKNMSDHKISETNRRIKIIENALIAAYLSGNLPCPASLNGDVSYISKNSLLEDCSLAGDIYLKSSYYYGAVPIANLNLPNYYAFDSWGRKLSYILYRGEDILESDKILYHIISHGPNGYNGYSLNGKRHIKSKDEYENNNAIIANNYEHISDYPKRAIYDDIVISRNAKFFVKIAAENYSQDPLICALSEHISGNNKNCNLFKNKMERLCLREGPKIE